MRVILKSGVEFSIKCDKFTINRDGFGNVRGYDIGGIVENKPVYGDPFGDYRLLLLAA